MSDDDGIPPVVGVIIMIGITVILAAVLGTVILGTGEDGGSAEAQTPSDPLDEANVERVVDEEAGVVCYTFAYGSKGGIDCLPLNETQLAPGGAA